MVVAAMPKIIRAASGMRMPWKNGGGWTTRIAVWPDCAGADDFDWRLSIAEIERAEPYSIFPGIDRTQMLLSGPGLVLTGCSERHELKAPYEVTGFSGDTLLACEPAGACRVLNVMSRRGVVSAGVSVVRGNACVKVDSGHLVLHVAAGEYVFRANSPNDGVLQTADTLVLDAGEVWFEGRADAVMVAVRFEAVPI